MGIYIWGTGCGAAEVFEKGLDIHAVTAFVDSFPMRDSFLGRPVILPEDLPKDPELLLITTRHAGAVSKVCRELEINEERILYIKDHNVLKDRNAGCTAAEEILGTKLLSALVPNQYLVTAPGSLPELTIRDGNDYVRLATLELLTRQLQNIPGAMAELGVYKGAFSRCLNTLMPERTLYLFDSFRGFLPQEAAREQGRETCGEGFLEAHRNTAAEKVLSSMPHRESIVLKAGYFPASLEGLEDRFCLVSLDADFRETTLEGLRYFWPRMVPGGYLMLHDWGCPRLTGVSEALALYEQELGQKLPGIPIPDLGNSLIIQKVSIT